MVSKRFGIKNTPAGLCSELSKGDCLLDVAIIGAGVLGLQLGRKLHSLGIKDIAVFEAEKFPGEHSSSRNSGVLHAGIYYPKNSLKQALCVEGNSLWTSLAKELNVSLLRTGKYIVSTSSIGDEELKKLFNFIQEKGVPKVGWATYEKIKEIEDYVNVSSAIFSETTGIINVSELIKTLKEDLFQRNVPLLLNQAVTMISIKNSGYEIKVGEDLIYCKKLINCAGLKAVSLRKMLGLIDIEDHWIKGRYLKLNKSYYTKSLIYPMPPKDLKGLGVHTSFDFDNVVRFGPDTKNINSIDYSLDERVVDEMYPEIKKVFKGIEKKDLTLDYAGIRSKVLKNGSVFDDFIIEETLPGYIECLGIDSPGVTASPAIVNLVATKLLKP